MSFQKEIDQAIKEKRLYFIGDSLPADWYAGFRSWLPLAEAGDPKAQYNVGRCYSRGDGVDKDESAAIEWYMKAAEQGEPRAHFNLYIQYDENKDTVKAQEWLAKAVELKEPRALNAVKERSIDENRTIAYKALEVGDKVKARGIYKELLDKGDVYSELGLIACDIEITIENSSVQHYYNYTASVTTSPGGYVGGGGTQTASYLNPAVLFKLKNNSSQPALIKVWVEKYDYWNPEKKIGDRKALSFISIGPGEVTELKEELHLTDKEPVRVYFSGVSVLRRDVYEGIKPDEFLTYFFQNKVLAWEPTGRAAKKTTPMSAAGVAWLGTLFVGFIPSLLMHLLRKNDDEFTKTHVKESLNWAITATIGYFLAILLATLGLVGMSGMVMFAVVVCHIIFCLKGKSNASDGKPYNVPFAVRFVK